MKNAKTYVYMAMATLVGLKFGLKTGGMVFTIWFLAQALISEILEWLDNK